MNNATRSNARKTLTNHPARAYLLRMTPRVIAGLALLVGVAVTGAAPTSATPPTPAQADHLLEPSAAPDVRLKIRAGCRQDSAIYVLRLHNAGERTRAIRVAAVTAGHKSMIPTRQLRPGQRDRDVWRVDSTLPVRVVYRSQHRVIMRATLAGGC